MCPGTVNRYVMYRGSRRGIYLMDYYARMEKRDIAAGGPTGPRPEGVSLRPEDIVARAAAVLRENDMGGWTRASPTLYPHQWSWDSAFIAIGLAHLDTGRAAGEIRSLLRAPVGQRQDPPHSLQPRRATGELLPRPRALGERRRSTRRPHGPRHDERTLPAAGARYRGPAHPPRRRGAGRRRRRSERVSGRGLPEAAGVAPVSRHEAATPKVPGS